MAKEMDRRAREARQRLVAQHEKVDSIEKMLGHAKKLEANAMLRAHRAGVPQAEIARVLGVVPGRVWQQLRDAGAFDVAPDEPVAVHEGHLEPVEG